MDMAKVRILIVEDDVIVAQDLQARLRRWGYETARAKSGREALAMFDVLRPDVVLLDIALRGELDGIDVAAELGCRSSAVALI
jgi:CheY-like chemotaxis protein